MKRLKPMSTDDATLDLEQGAGETKNEIEPTLDSVDSVGKKETQQNEHTALDYVQDKKETQREPPPTVVAEPQAVVHANPDGVITSVYIPPAYETVEVRDSLGIIIGYQEVPVRAPRVVYYDRYGFRYRGNTFDPIRNEDLLDPMVKLLSSPPSKNLSLSPTPVLY